MAFTHTGDDIHWVHQHDTVVEARECEDEIARDAYELWSIAGEREAERRNERYFEERGYWDARAQEDIEAARGVIPFDVAYAAAVA